jgi:small subunit ribosomal protein S17
MANQKSKIKSQNTKVTENTTESKASTTPTQVVRGRVVSVKATKTAVVIVERKKSHPIYQKSFTRTKKFQVHDELGVREGDIVEFVKTRPISKMKHWQIVKVVGRDIEAIVNEELKQEVAEAIAEVMPAEAEITTEEAVEAAVEETEKSDKKPKAKKESKKKGTK